jgi:hypothetical protein
MLRGGDDLTEKARTSGRKGSPEPAEFADRVMRPLDVGETQCPGPNDADGRC